MTYDGIRKVAIFTFAAFLFIFTTDFIDHVRASDPLSAYYSSDNDRIFWFILISDAQIGAYNGNGSENLEWIVTEAKDVIEPEFIVNEGDLTDSTNWDSDLWPDGPWQDEWEEYLSILETNEVDSSFYYDIPGNHDHYNDEYFDYYLSYSIQGRATGQTQISWTRTFDFGTYHFLGINTAGNDGAGFNLWPIDNFGDHAGLDETELQFIEEELKQNKDVDLTLIFGHHPIEKRSSEWTDTALSEGADEFVELMNQYGVLMYGYGHTHTYREEVFTQGMTEGVLYLNTKSIYSSDESQYTLIAIDCNGLSVVPVDLRTWPVVLITAPLDTGLGGGNPFVYPVPKFHSNPIRALVFDESPITSVQYRIDETSDWYPMTRVETNPHLWEGQWDATLLSDEGYTIEVQATGSSTRSDSITIGFNTDTSSSASDSSEEDENCFITIAAHGSSVAREVTDLKAFKDDFFSLLFRNILAF
ncbi:MAG: metallophosphoesterase [Thermodesulfobacteriota bacterium]|nr:metallophosphoesterase [Thermodesulfobacteriota bacterium]